MLFDCARIAVSSFTLQSMDREDCMQHAILKVLEEKKESEKRAYIIRRMRLRIYDWLRKQRNTLNIEEITPLYYEDVYGIIERLPENSIHRYFVWALLTGGSPKEAASIIGVSVPTVYLRLAEVRRILRG